VAETLYAPCGDLSLAYQVFGDGPVELVFVPPYTSHVELFWTLPGFKANLDQLATFCRVLLFDKAGVGLSDPVPHVPTLDDRAAEIEAVMDAVGFGQAVLFALSDGLAASSHAAPSPSRRALRTVLFTDIVASTARAAAAGDERWRAVLQRFDEITADLTQRFGGTVVKSTGDGHLATFDGPTRAIRCAEALRADAETLGIQIHTGECELLGTDIGGLAVHIAARILGQAGAGEILVSRTVRDLVVGSGTGFEDRGSVELRGVPGTWQLLAVNRHGPPVGSAEAELASTPTPGPRTAMRRSDRAVAVMARRAPWLLRGMAHLAPATGRR
jgi:class 3 adenylate cyclase